MTALKQLNVWMASTTTERDALGTDQGLAVGDFCLVDSLGFYLAVAAGATSSTWRPIATTPTNGPYALGDKNTADTTNRALFQMQSVTFRASLDATPSSITLVSNFNQAWPNLPTVYWMLPTGFVYYGFSNTIAPNFIAYQRGTYQIMY